MSEIFWNALAAASFLSLLAASIMLARGRRQLTWLRDALPLPPPAQRPTLSVLAPARNEARNIEAAVRAMLAQDYLGLEVIVVDDRSTDQTPAILARLQAEMPQLRIVSISQLPPGWLGKNYANSRAAAEARGELLLFTDADVVLAPGTLQRAVGHFVRERLDMLAVGPEAPMPGLLLSQFTLYFGILFSLFARPWAASNPRSRAHVGIGAFNLLRATAYRAAGGHEAIRLRPDDDLKLGKLVKQAGFRQAFAIGRGCVKVEWYDSWRALRDGLMKNLFAGAEYRVGLVAAGVLLHLLVLVLPPVALLFTAGAAWWLYLGCCLLFLWQGIAAAPAFGTRRWAGVLLPALALFGAFLMVRATALTLLRDGIEWRGTRYSLAELRRNKV